MDPEIDLPPMLVSRNASPTPPDPSDLDHWRKRSRLEYDVATSSDPALFSSDDHAPTAETYASKRRKEQWQGTWWGEKFHQRRSTMSKRVKRKLSRNFDSGVCMGSEGTDTSLEDEFVENTRSNGIPAGILDFSLGRNDRGLNDPGDVYHHHPSQQTALEDAQNSLLYTFVDRVIERCLEAGDENVDLSSMSLESVSDESLRRLKGLTKHATIQEIPPSQDVYLPIEAALRLYLSNNSISSFPSAILSLTKLRVLSLRHNKLTRIPPTVANLPSLEHLNIAGNRLQYLPYEMLHLCDRPDFDMIATPNPFEQAQPELLITSCSKDLIPKPRSLLARTSPMYFEVDGSRSDKAPTAASSSVPSLFELALQKCHSLPDLSDIQACCVDGETPATLSAPLTMAQEARSYGELECTMCQRCFIIPRVQWMEWWILVPAKKKESRPTCEDPSMIPFLRRGCSWACVVEEAESGYST